MASFKETFLLIFCIFFGWALSEDPLRLLPQNHENYDTKIPGALHAYFKGLSSSNNVPLDQIQNIPIWSNDLTSDVVEVKGNLLQQQDLYKICEQFHLVLLTEFEQKKIDCKDLKFVPKSQEKRSIDQANHDEGSGNGPETIDKEFEPIKQDQSDLTHPVKEVGPKSLGKLAKIQEEPKDAASSESKASSDTKILLILFLGVAAIGAAAFAYNFYKKRRGPEPVATEDINLQKPPTKEEESPVRISLQPAQEPLLNQ